MHEVITSNQNPRVKAALRLRSQSAAKRNGLFVIDGPRTLRQAIAANVEPDSVFLDSQFADLEHLLQSESDTQRLDTTIVQRWQRKVCLYSSTVMGALAFGDTEHPVVAVCREPEFDLTTWGWSSSPPSIDQRSLLLVMAEIEKPGNIGAMLRTADAAGVQGVLMCNRICDPLNANAIRASQGAVFHLPISKSDTPSAMRWLVDQKYQIVAARVDGQQLYTDFAWSNRVAIVVGNEAHGLNASWEHTAVRSVQLPMRGVVDSLNVSVSAAILLYDAAHRMQG